MSDTPDWVLVPREPSMGQRVAGFKAMNEARYQDPCGKTEYDRVPLAVYYAMLAAAPVPSPEHPLRDRGEGEFRRGVLAAAAVAKYGMDRAQRDYRTDSSGGSHAYRMAEEIHEAILASLPPARVEEGLRAEVERLKEALKVARPYVEQAVNDDGGIDNCEIGDRIALERVDAALGEAP